MNSAEALTVGGVHALLAGAFAALEERKQEINDLNVYPVPDGDTGTNLALTMRGILDAIGRLSGGADRHELCGAISQAALMGARGNSGVILSQIIRGAMDVLGRPDPVTPEVVARSFRHATETAYRAVRRPVEGTMLTVLRDMASKSEEMVHLSDPAAFLDEVIAEGWKSVERTPSLLRVLADAGVVDAGGYGLVVLLEGAARGGKDAAVPIQTRVERLSVLEESLATEDMEELSEFTYCTSYLLTGNGLDKERLEDELSRLGDSLLVVGDNGQVKIHVHTDEPGRVLALGTSLGVLSEIEIDNMEEQTQARSRRLAEAGAGSADPGSTQVVAVVAGEGNKRLFRNLGVDFIVDGGQSMNPSAEDILRAVEKVAAPSAVILPNNANVIMTAEQTAKLSDKEILVVPSRSVQAGLSAAVAYDRRSDGATNAEDMRAALEAVVTGEVCRAVRDSLVDGVQVKAGEFIGLIDDRVVSSSPELEAVLRDVVSRLVEGGREILTVLVGEGEEGGQALEVVESLRDALPQIEIDVHEGGQPFYPVWLSAE